MERLRCPMNGRSWRKAAPGCPSCCDGSIGTTIISQRGISMIRPVPAWWRICRITPPRPIGGNTYTIFWPNTPDRDGWFCHASFATTFYFASAIHAVAPPFRKKAHCIAPVRLQARSRRLCLPPPFCVRLHGIPESAPSAPVRLNAAF